MLQAAARFFSLVFHPLLIFSYMLVLLLLVNPYQFGVHTIHERMLLIIVVFFSTFIIPVVAIGMLKAMNFVQSWEMDDRMDRIIPYVATGVFYISIYYYLLKEPSVPMTFKTFVLGGVIALFAAFFINNFSKISIHAVGMGGMLAMTVLLMTFFKQYSFLVELSASSTIRISMVSVLLVVILLCGIVGTSRLILGAHKPKDLWGGYLIGIAAQLIALQLLF